MCCDSPLNSEHVYSAAQHAQRSSEIMPRAHDRCNGKTKPKNKNIKNI